MRRVNLTGEIVFANLPTQWHGKFRAFTTGRLAPSADGQTLMIDQLYLTHPTEPAGIVLYHTQVDRLDFENTQIPSNQTMGPTRFQGAGHSYQFQRLKMELGISRVAPGPQKPEGLLLTFLERDQELLHYQLSRSASDIQRAISDPCVMLERHVRDYRACEQVRGHR